MPEKIALITGASRGLGRSAAIHLARRGVSVIGTYNANRDAADDALTEIEQSGVTAAMLQLDVRRPDTFAAFAETVAQTLRERFGTDHVDYLFNNAGTGLMKPFIETTESDLDTMIAEHLKAPFLLSQALLGLLADNGRILNSGTGLDRFTYPGFSAYAAAKGGLEVLTRYMAQELGAARGIRVNAVAPGATATDFGGGAVRDNADFNASVASRVALGRPGDPEDIGAGVAAILSDDLAWANGIRIELSGGQSL